MKYWKGYSMVAIAVLHTVVAGIQFYKPYAEMIAAGLVNSVMNPLTGLAAWFLLFGMLLFVLGILVLSLEKAEENVPMLAIYTLLGLTLLGVIIMPESGFWLLFPPLIAFLFQKKVKRLRAIFYG